MKGKRNIFLLIGAIILIISFVYVRYQKMSLETVATEKKLPIHCIESEEKEIALTFDINWAEKDYLKNILDVLDKYDVKATFFIIGKWVNYTDENLKNLKIINEKGHEIGNHSYIHPNFSGLRDDLIEKEIIKTEKVIYEATGVKTTLFRFPSGDYSNNSLRKVESMGYIPIQWNIDSVDWREDGKEKEYKRVKDKVKEGSIILYHNNAKYTVENVDKLIRELKKDGYSFKKVGEMIYKDSYYIDSQGIQHKK